MCIVFPHCNSSQQLPDLSLCMLIVNYPSTVKKFKMSPFFLKSRQQCLTAVLQCKHIEMGMVCSKWKRGDVRSFTISPQEIHLWSGVCDKSWRKTPNKATENDTSDRAQCDHMGLQDLNSLLQSTGLLPLIFGWPRRLWSDSGYGK